MAPALRDDDYQAAGDRRLRNRALASGVAVAAVYALASLLSARLGVVGPPVLDGLRPPASYRWVNPPSDLAAGNQKPFGGKFPVELTKEGSTAAAFSTRDGQLTLVISAGSIPAAADQKSVQVTITPLDPATLGPAPKDLEFLGNAYRVEAAYQPSGDPVTELQGGGDQRIILVYPAVAGGASHAARTILQSADGKSWEKLASQDSAAQQQVQAKVSGLGYFAAARPVESGGLGASAIGIIVLAVVVAVLGALVIARNVRRTPSSRRTRK